jgi:hypothetical protein
VERHLARDALLAPGQASARDRRVLPRNDSSTCRSSSGEFGEQREAFDSLKQLRLVEDQPLNIVLSTIVAMQQAVTKLFDRVNVDDPLAKDPAFIELKNQLSKQGDVMQRLEPYNINAQTWNNQQDDWLGRMFFAIFDLSPRQLLNPDGTVEFETEVRI